jgi:rhamnose transport system substrate-binding protein
LLNVLKFKSKEKSIMSKRFNFVFALLVIGSMLLAACAPAATQAPAVAATQAPAVATQAPAAAATEAPAAGPIKIVYIPKNTGNPYFDSIIGGFTKACEELKCEFTTTAPATAEATSQVSFVKEQIQRGVNVIAISPNSPDALNQVFDEARSKGITVLIVNSDIPKNESHRDAAVLPMDFTITGSSQVELMGSLIGYEGKIAVLSATADAPDQNTWIEGMKVALKDPKYAKMELVDVVYGDDDPQKSLTECESLLSKYSDLRGIISPTTVGVAASAQCVESAGRYPGGANAVGGGLEVTGLGTPNQMRRFIEDGIVKAFALWSPYDEGYLSAYLAVSVVKGETTIKEGNTFTVPKLGERTIGKDGVIITGPPTVFDKNNIADFNF